MSGRRSRTAVRVARSGARGGSDGPDDGLDDGSAGVREPRRPRPLGPNGGAGERPLPQDPTPIEETQCRIERT
ncbi:hypothetical protein Q5530_14780 [Saccharothrix sp. BKS2]|uniref:hypothetical protein n=1 Tax=Saccharothrix sp. BKS2 TaxID=3064400 RepID=UPI0039E77FEA